MHLSKHLPAEVFEQITAERLVTRYVKGHPKLEWIKPPGKRNEALDCAVYALAAAYYMHVDRWREGDWAKWQSRVETADLFDTAAAAAAAQPSAPAPPVAAPAAQPPAPPRKPRARGQLRGGPSPWSP